MKLVFFGLFLFVTLASAHPGEHTGLRHWELASRDPDRIFLSFDGDPASTRAVTWRTHEDVETACAEIVEAIAEASFTRGARRIPAHTEVVDLRRFAQNKQGGVAYHSVRFEELKPDTLYAYRVGDGADHWSEWIQFRTASAAPEPFTFLYFGDAQNAVLSRWSRTIRMAAQVAPEAAFAVHAGDLINTAHTDLEWAEWFKAGGFLHRQWTGIPVAGNHEYRVLSAEGRDNQKVLSFLWRPQFTLPVVASLPAELQETVYTVAYQGMQIIVLNSNRQEAAQRAFLEEELAKPGFRWRVVTFHHPVFPPRGRGDKGARRRELWKDLFDEYGVDLVLQGHDHAYSRGQVPVRQSDGSFEGPPQTLYITSVSGPKQYEILPEVFEGYRADGLETQRVGENTQFFQVIRVERNALHYAAYTAVGSLYDAFTLQKDAVTGEKTLLEAVPPAPERTFENTAPYERNF